MRQFALSGPYVTTWPNGQNTLGIRPTGVSAFVGPTFAGPVGELSPALRSFAEFQALYGGLEHLPVTADTPRTQRLHLLGHAAHAFFAQGGQRLHVVRVETPLGLESDPAAVLAAHAHGLRQLDDEPDVSLVAMPAAMALHGHDAALRQQLMQLLLDHVSDPMRCRMAILDAPAEADVDDVLAWRQSLDCAQAALYHPWLVVPDPTAPSETLSLPPSGFLCGIYARSDALRGVHRAPANEVLHGVLRLSYPLSHQEQIQLTAQGVNSLRTLSGLGTLVWGARTLSRDPQWQYVSVRRQFDHLKACLTQGLQWVVFEANEEPLWTQVRDRIDGFLMEEWQLGALAGQRPEQAYYVRCDRSTMTEADQRAGRLVCQIGVAQTRPSEFRVLRLELTTAPGRGSVDL
jgi:phage tail sheath protein FI